MAHCDWSQGSPELVLCAGDLGNLSICAPLAISSSEPFIHTLIRSFLAFTSSSLPLFHWSVALFAFDTASISTSTSISLKAVFRALGILCMCPLPPLISLLLPVNGLLLLMLLLMLMLSIATFGRRSRYTVWRKRNQCASESAAAAGALAKRRERERK